MISIIVPVYNVAKYLPACIESILAQSYSDFEVLLVDDGSIDESLDICNHYTAQDNRIKVLAKKNGGVSSARNHGLDNSNGEWVTFVDGDDYVSEFYLENMMRAIESQSKSDLVVTGFTRVDDSDSHNIIDKWTYPNDTISTQCITFNQLNKITSWGIVTAKLFRFSIIKQHNLRFTNIPIKEDVVFLLNFLDLCNLVTLTDCNDYLYVQRNGSALNNNRSQDKKIAQHKLFCSAMDKTEFSNHKIKDFARHSGVWSVISEVYSFCDNISERKRHLKDLDFSALNAACLAPYSMSKIDAFDIWLLKHQYLLAFDVIKRSQVHLLNFISVLKTQKK